MQKYPTPKEMRAVLEVMLKRIKANVPKSWAAKERFLTKKALKSRHRAELEQAVIAWCDRNDLPMDEHIIQMALYSAEIHGYVQRVKA